MRKLFCMLFLSVLTSTVGTTGKNQNFDKAIAEVLGHEGGFVNNIHDSGGATNFGISLKYLKGLGSMGDLNHDGRIDMNDPKSLTKAAAAQMYKKDFWDKYKFYQIKDVILASKLLDMAVNLGPKRCMLLLNNAVNVLDPKAERIIADNIAKLNVYNPERLVQAVIAQLDKFYILLAQNRRSDSIFLRGWLRRANDITLDGK